MRLVQGKWGPASRPGLAVTVAVYGEPPYLNTADGKAAFETNSGLKARMQNGLTLWNHPTDGVVIAPVTIANGVVYVPTTLGLEILDATTGESLWTDGDRGTLYSQAVVVDGAVYCTYVKGEIVAWRLPE